jgi:hypothetical protein
MSFRIVLVSFAVFLVPGGLVRSVAERLVLGKPAHANPDGFLLRFDFKRSLVRFDDPAHMALAQVLTPAFAFVVPNVGEYLPSTARPLQCAR